MTVLLELLSNTLVLYHVAPYLPVSSLLALGVTSKAFRELIYETPKVFRYLNLSAVKAVQVKVSAIDHGGQTWRNVQLDENLTEDEFYSGPLRGIFGGLQRRHVLQDVHTLILDGLSVTSELLSEIILSDRFRVQILSIREARNLNQRKLMKVLEYALRPSRPDNSPFLRGLYIFGERDTSLLSVASHWNRRSKEELEGSEEKWYHQTGKMICKPPMDGWAETMMLCQGVIAFDAILCGSSRHTSGPPAVATVALRGCNVCHSAPERLTRYGMESDYRYPLLAPPPLHSSTLRAATRPANSSKARLLARCLDCVRNRYCESCHKWWCEDCYDGIRSGMDFTNELGVIRDCWECGLNCSDCVQQTRRMCKVCGGGYCSIHNEGSTITTCDWCARARRQTRDLY